MIVTVNNLSFCYGSTKVLENLDFTARPGELTSIIGPNGAGKTTLLKCVADLFKQTQIPRSISVPESNSKGLPVTIFRPSSSSALAYFSLAKEVMDH